MFGLIATTLLLNFSALAQDQLKDHLDQRTEDVCVNPPSSRVYVSPALFRYAMRNLFSQVGSIQVIPLNDHKNFHVMVELQPYARLSDPNSSLPEDPQDRLMRQLGLRTYGKSSSSGKENSFLENVIKNHVDAGRGTFMWDLGTTVNGNLVIDVKDNQERKIGFVKIGASFEVDKIAVNVFGSPGVSMPSQGRVRTSVGPPSVALFGGSIEFSADRFTASARFKMVRMALDDGEKPLSGLFNCSLSYKIPQGMQFGFDVPTYVAPASAAHSSVPLVYVLPTARIVIPLTMASFRKDSFHIPTRRVRMDVGN